MYYLVPLSYKDTLQVRYYILVMKKIAIWPYYMLLYDVLYLKTIQLGLDHLFVLGKWTIDIQDIPYPMI